MGHFDHIDVLDKGFVELIGDNIADGDNMISMIARAARVSTGKDGEQRPFEDDVRLVTFLAEHRHHSPFEHVILTFRIKAPLSVNIHFLRHRTAKVNAESARYRKVRTEFYEPVIFRRQSKVNKQASEIDVIDDNQRAIEIFKNAIDVAAQAYEELINLGVAREQARGVLPEFRYTTWIWTIDLRNLMHFLLLRSASDAQLETRSYAYAIDELLFRRDRDSWFELKGLVKHFC